MSQFTRYLSNQRMNRSKHMVKPHPLSSSILQSIKSAAIGAMSTMIAFILLKEDSMPTLKELVAQKEAIEAQIAETIQAEKKAAINQVKALVAEFGLTAPEIFSSAAKARKAKRPAVAAKYRDPATGETWSGRGRAPNWITGKDRDAFKV